MPIGEVEISPGQTSCSVLSIRLYHAINNIHHGHLDLTRPCTVGSVVQSIDVPAVFLLSLLILFHDFDHNAFFLFAAFRFAGASWSLECAKVRRRLVRVEHSSHCVFLFAAFSITIVCTLDGISLTSQSRAKIRRS
jgi:hypothetical protein